MCASPDTPIATPSGDRAIAELVPGDLVYSEDHGAIIAVPIARVRKQPVHVHQVLRIELSGGRVLEVSGSHPLPDGRPLSELRPGDRLGTERVISSERVPYRYDATYDVLPASETGSYFAAGVELGSTLAR